MASTKCQIVLSFAPSAAAVWHCERGRITCERNSVQHNVFCKRWAKQFVIWRFFYGSFVEFQGQFCGDFLLLFGVILATFGVPGHRGPSRDPFWQHGRKRDENKLDFLSFWAPFWGPSGRPLEPFSVLVATPRAEEPKKRRIARCLVAGSIFHRIF